MAEFGKWHVCGTGIHAMVRDEGSRIIAIRHRLPGQENGEIMRLIAQSPALLAALQELVDAFDRPSRQFSDVTRKEMEPWIQQAKTTIAASQQQQQ